jgi:hypothetical protein
VIIHSPRLLIPDEPKELYERNMGGSVVSTTLTAQ